MALLHLAEERIGQAMRAYEATENRKAAASAKAAATPKKR